MAPPATPPPLRRARSKGNGGPPPRPGSLGIAPLVDDGPAGDDLGDPAEGEWLFKQGDVVLGPVAASVLLERIEAGEVDADTPVGREAGNWRPLSEVPHFFEVYERAAEARRRERERQAREAQRRRVRALRVSLMVAVALIPFVAGSLLGRTLMIKRPWDDSEEWLQRAPPLVDLPPKPPEANKPKQPKKPPVDRPADPDEGDRVASADGPRGDDAVAARGADDRDDRKARKDRKGRKGGRGKETRLAKADKRDKKGDKAKSDKKGKDKGERLARASDDKPSGRLPETLTAQQVQQGLVKGKSGIGSCLKAEATRNPDMPGVVTLMFTVTEQGKAINIKLKEREVRNGPLANCLVKVVSKLRWPKFTGERKNAEFPFRIKR